MSRYAVKCPNCHTEQTQEAKFCNACGTTLPERVTAACPICKMENDASRARCAYCGGRLRTKDVLVFKPFKEPRMVKGMLVRNWILLLTAVALLIFAFLPIATTKIEYGEVEVSFSASAWTPFMWLFDAAQSLDSSEVEKSELYAEWEDTTEALANDALAEVMLTDKTERLISDVTLQGLRLILISDQIDVRTTHVIAAVICALYLLLCAALFIVATVNVILYLIKRKSFLYGAVVSLLCLLTALLPVVSFTVLTELSSVGLLMGKAMGIGVILSLLVAGAALLYLMIDRLARIRVGFSAGKVLCRAASVLCMVVFFVAAFLPMAHTRIDPSPKETEDKTEMTFSVYATDFASYDMLFDEEIKQYGEMEQQEARLLAQEQIFTMKRLNQTTFYDMTDRVLYSLLQENILMGGDGRDTSLLYAAISWVFLAALLGAALLTWQILKLCVFGYSARWTRLVGKIFAGLLNGAFLAFTIVLLVTFKANVAYLNLDASVIMQLGVGSMVMPLAVLVACALPAGRRTVIYVSESPIEANAAAEALEEQSEENTAKLTESCALEEAESGEPIEQEESTDQPNADPQTVAETAQ